MQADPGQFRAVTDELAVRRARKQHEAEVAWGREMLASWRARQLAGLLAVPGGSEGRSGRSGRLRGGGPRPGHLQAVRSEP